LPLKTKTRWADWEIILRLQLAIFVLLSGFAVSASGRSTVPDVIPGEGWRLVRQLPAGPFRLGVYQAGKQLSLRLADGKGAVAGNDAWITVDDGLVVGDPGLGSNPSTLTVATTLIDSRVSGLFVIHVSTSAVSVGVPTAASHFVVRRENGKSRLICRLPDGPGEVAILETTPALILVVTAGGEHVRFSAGDNALCVLEPSEAEPGPGPAQELLLAATVAQGEMFRTAGDWKRAGDAFQRALHLRPTGRGAERLARSAIEMRSNYNDLQCWQQDRDDLRELPIQGLLKLRLESYDDYLSFFPNNEDAARVRYREADLLDGCNHLEAAARLYREVSQSSPDVALGRYARQRYDAILERIRRRDQNGPSTHPTNGAAAKPAVEPAGRPRAHRLTPGP